MRKIINILAIATIWPLAAEEAPQQWFSGWEGGEWRLRTSVYTVHYKPQPAHNNHQKLVGVEYRRPDDWLGGAAYFRNSFDQPSVYVYIGHEWHLWQHEAWRLRTAITGGLLYGYRGEYRDKIPFNRYGVAPALLPSITLDYHHFFVELQFLAASGMLAAMGFRHTLD